MTEKVSERLFFLYRPMQNGMVSAVFGEKRKEDNFRKILYKVYTFLIDFLSLCVILTIEQMRQKTCESVRA